MAKPTKTSATTKQEEVLNVRLARLLRQQGLQSEPEFIVPNTKGERIDVRIDLPGNFIVALEAKKGFSASIKDKVLKQAKGRLVLPQVDSAVAVCYPDGLSQDSDLDENTQLWVRPVTSEWVECKLKDLVAIVQRTPQELGDPNIAAELLKKNLDMAVEVLSDVQCDGIARCLGLPKGGEGWQKKAALRGLLVIAAASMFHARLDNEPPNKPQRDARTGKPFKDNWPPASLQACLSTPSTIESLKAAWELILTVDYRPVFETAIAALDAPARDAKWEKAVRTVAQASLKLSGNVAVMRHDLLGRLFHRMLDTARYDGSFYTSTATATLLAGLAIPEKQKNGKKWELEKLRIVDPACGTGTLLMAAAERIQDISPGGRSTHLGKTLLEDILHGYDINLSATHMAATTLGLLSPNVQFHKMNIYETFYGIVKGVAHIGSLEFYAGGARLNVWPTARQTDSGEDMEEQKLTKHDMVIMNPPFTRDSLRYDQLTKADEKVMKKREKDVFAGKPTHLSGQSGMFLLLADKLANSETGCVASVLPLASAGAPSSFKTWNYLLGKGNFWVEIVVVSHDSERICFSENTKISEMLIVLRRKSDAGYEPPPPRQDSPVISKSVSADTNHSHLRSISCRQAVRTRGRELIRMAAG